MSKEKQQFFRKAVFRILLMLFVGGTFLVGTVGTIGTVSASVPPEEEQQLDSDCETLDSCGIVDLVITIINILSAVVGVIVVIMIVIGGIQYTSARDNPQAVAAARERIINALLALVFYLGITAFLQWVVPGGVFSG